jgi:DNA-binding MarR family transcriptional regulator
MSERASESSAMSERASEIIETPELSELLCFDIYAASRAITGVYRTVLAPWNLTYPQYLVLVVLGREKSCTIKYLGESLQLDYGTLTPLLRRMEARGLLTRSRGAQDERVVTLELTGEGRKLAVLTSDVQQKIRAAVGLGDQEALALQGTLRAVTGSVREHAENASG